MGEVVHPLINAMEKKPQYKIGRVLQIETYIGRVLGHQKKMSWSWVPKQEGTPTLYSLYHPI